MVRLLLSLLTFLVLGLTVLSRGFVEGQKVSEMQGLLGRPRLQSQAHLIVLLRMVLATMSAEAEATCCGLAFRHACACSGRVLSCLVQSAAALEDLRQQSSAGAWWEYGARRVMA